MVREQTQYEKLERMNLSDVVFTKLKDAILGGELKPGQKLRQTELSKRYGISRAPVRDAIRKLDAEGLVRLNSGAAVVSAIDLREFQELYRIREVLEGLAAGMAAPNMTDEGLTALTDMVEKMEEASRKGDLEHWLELDLKFHTCSYKPCNSPNLLKMISGLWNSTHYTRRAYCRLPGKIERAEQMHRRMLTALAARDGELYGRLVREHIKESVRSVLESPSVIPSGSPMEAPKGSAETPENE